MSDSPFSIIVRQDTDSFDLCVGKVVTVDQFVESLKRSGVVYLHCVESGKIRCEDGDMIDEYKLCAEPPILTLACERGYRVGSTDIDMEDVRAFLSENSD